MKRLLATLLVFDPGFSNLRNAFRGTLAVVTTFFLTSLLARHFAQPPVLAFLAVLIAMMISLIVNDSTKRQQQATMLWIALPASLGCAFSTVLSGWPVIRFAVFLVIIFVTVYLRRRGIRWFALGFIAFMSYFTALFFPLIIENIPAAIAAALLGTFVAFALRFWVLPDREQSLLKLYLKGFDLGSGKILSLLSRSFSSLSSGPLPPDEEKLEKIRARLRKAVGKLNELSLIIEQFLGTTESDALRSDAETLILRIFEQELSLRNVLHASAIFISTNGIDRESVLAAAQKVDETAHMIAVRPREKEIIKEVSVSAYPPSLIGFCRSLEDFAASLNRLQSGEAELAVIQGTQAGNESQMRSKAETQGLHFNTKQAIQATLATGLASLAGYMVSPARWYWAAVTAFVIFVGSSRGETMNRAFLRIVGTVAGLATGLVVVQLFSGQKGSEFSVILICIFFGVYLSRIAFGFWTATLFTIMVAVLFDLMGQMSSQILTLRFEETVIGAVIGALVSAFVLPTSTHATVRAAAARFLLTASDVIDALPSAKPSLFSRRELIRRLRALDRDLLALRVAAAPIVGQVSLMRKGDLPGALYDASALVHFVRRLATYPPSQNELSIDQILARCDQLTAKMRARASDLEDFGYSKAPEKKAEAVSPVLFSTGETLNPLFDRVEQILASLELRHI